MSWLQGDEEEMFGFGLWLWLGLAISAWLRFFVSILSLPLTLPFLSFFALDFFFSAVARTIALKEGKLEASASASALEFGLVASMSKPIPRNTPTIVLELTQPTRSPSGASGSVLLVNSEEPPIWVATRGRMEGGTRRPRG